MPGYVWFDLMVLFIYDICLLVCCLLWILVCLCLCLVFVFAVLG